MTGRIFAAGADGRLHELRELPYGSEVLLQRSLALYPALVAGDQVDSSAHPRA